MSDMAFGGGPEMLQKGDPTGRWALIEAGIKYCHLSHLHTGEF